MVVTGRPVCCGLARISGSLPSKLPEAWLNIEDTGANHPTTSYLKPQPVPASLDSLEVWDQVNPKQFY